MRLKAQTMLLKEKYGSYLTNIQAIKELDMKNGSELSKVLYSPALPNLSALHVAMFKLSRPTQTISQKLHLKYNKNPLTLDEFAHELALTTREANALIKMKILLGSTIEEVDVFVNNHNKFFKILTQKNRIKEMFHNFKLTQNEIGNILGIRGTQVRTYILRYGLEKKKFSNVTCKGKIGYKMSPKEVESNRRRQPTAKALIVVDSRSFKVIGEFISTKEAHRVGGFIRENIRRSCNSFKIARSSSGKAIGIYGVVESNYKFFWKASYQADRAKIVKMVAKTIKEEEISRQDAVRAFGHGLVKEVFKQSVLCSMEGK
jgi:predicted Zn-dependent protease